MSLYKHEIDKVVREKYNMSNILENDIDGIVPLSLLFSIGNLLVCIYPKLVKV